MSDDLIRLADRAEALADIAMFQAAPAGFAQAVGLQSHEVAGAHLSVAPGIPLTLFNRGFGVGNDGPVTDDDIAAMVEVYRMRGVQSCWLQVGPLGQRHGVDEQLLRLGFTRPDRRAWAKMVRRPEPVAVPSCAFEVRPVAAGEETAVAIAIASGFGMPPAFVPWLAAMMSAPGWQAFGAFDGRDAVGGGILYLAEGLAWLGVGAVVADARRKGAQRALMAARINAAVAAGVAHIVSETGEPVGEEPNPSLRNMYACGFEKVCARENFAAPV